jgi:hypothetical protein
MSDLLDFVTTAHGCIQRWVAAKSVWADVDIYGPTFEAKGQDKLLGPCNVSAWTNRQHVTLRSEQSGHTVVFDGALDRVVVTSSRGQTIEVLDRPRESMLDLKPTDAWTAAQAGYFVGYGMWSYLLEPYLLHWPGVQSREIDPWHERGETWRRLEVTFPNSLATHETTYVYYFDSRTGLQQRMDYAPEVLGGRPASHYTFEHRFWDGVPVPSARRILVRDSSGQADQSDARILIDVNAFGFTV